MAFLNNKKGVSVIEILIAGTIIAVTLVSFLSAAVFSLKTSSLAKQTIRAEEIAKGTIEAVRSFRNSVAWNNDDPADEYDGLGVITVNTAYHPEQSEGSPSQWKMVQTNDVVDGYNREVIFENVSRNPITNDIEESYNPLNNDSDSKKITVNISWENKKVEITTYLTNWNQ